MRNVYYRMNELQYQTTDIKLSNLTIINICNLCSIKINYYFTEICLNNLVSNKSIYHIVLINSWVFYVIILKNFVQKYRHKNIGPKYRPQI